MSFCVYAVRCNFLGTAERERAWNAWYDGPKLRQMLRLPLFLTMQRFRATALDTRRQYLALWLVRSPGAFETPEYRAQWGFAEWTQEIGDWSRDLYEAPDAIDAALDIGAGERLYLAAAEGMNDADARTATERARKQRPGVIWIASVGLDRHAPVLGLARLAHEDRVTPLGEGTGLAETVFTPLTKRARAPGA